MERKHGEEHPGWHWGIFTARIPFYHTRLHWPEFLQGVMVATATALALVPILVAYFGLSFEEAVAASFVHAMLLSTAYTLFGEPYAPGWITPALPLVLAFVLKEYADPTERFQVMAAMSMNFAALVLLLGVTGLGRKLIQWVPDVLKAGIIMGAAIAAFKQVFVDDAPRFLLMQPISTAVACGICLVLMFSIPVAKAKLKNRPLAMIASFGLLPGFLAAAIIGPLVGEVTYDIQWGWIWPPIGDMWAKASPLAIGWPSFEMFKAGLPLAIVAYILLFGDWVTGNALIRDAAANRPDEKIDINPTRSHISVGIRNAVMALVAPAFPTQGSLWTGVHVAVVQRWKEGRKSVDSLHSGIHSYNMMGLPFIFLLLPLITMMKPLMGIALSLTLILTGFACAFVAMAIPKDATERGTVLLIAASLALFSPWVGLSIAVLATLTMIGWSRSLEEID